MEMLKWKAIGPRSVGQTQVKPLPKPVCFKMG